MAKDLFDAVYGCMVAGVVGDALGAPVEGWYWNEIRAKHGKVAEFLPSSIGNTNGKPGVFTDDSALKYYTTLAILEKGGRVTPDDVAKIWIEKMDPKWFWANEKAIWYKLQWGINPWEAGKGSLPAAVSTMAVAPIGIINAGNPDQAYQDGFNIGGINSEDFNRDGGATMAAGIAAAFIPGATVESVLDTMYQKSAFVIKRAIELTMDLAYSSGDVDEFAAKFYDRMLDWTYPWPPQRGWDKNHFYCGNAREIIPATMAILYLCKGDVNQTMIEGASFGRDCDTIASIGGAIAGAMQGASAIRQDWIEQCEKANEPFYAEVGGDPQANQMYLSKKLIDVLCNEQKAAQQRAEFLEKLLS